MQCAQGQVILPAPSPNANTVQPTCVACTDPRLLSSSGSTGVASYGIDSSGVCDAQTCSPGYGLMDVYSQSGTDEGTGCQSCAFSNSPLYSPGGTSTCLLCSGTVDSLHTSCTVSLPASPKARNRNRRTPTEAERAIAARQYRYPREKRAEPHETRH